MILQRTYPYHWPQPEGTIEDEVNSPTDSETDDSPIPYARLGVFRIVFFSTFVIEDADAEEEDPRLATTSYKPLGNWKDLPKALDQPIQTFIPRESDFDA